MARIYVSSTYSDLKEYRKEVSKTLRRLGHEDVAMEYYVAEDKRPVDRCLSDVSSCDAYVGIFAWRYGYVPQVNNPENRSVTELEYRKAQDESIPCLIFLLSEEAPWPKIKQDRGVAAEQIESLREEIVSSERHMINFFENADELARKVNEAISKWAKDSGKVGKRQLADWDSYRWAVCNKHQWVRLQVIAGAAKDRGVAQIPLTEVFEPQLVALGTSSADVPDEVREYQKVIYGPKSEANEEETSVEDPEEAAELENEDPLLASNPELVLDTLGREPTQVILGGPGSGKSTILHYAMLKVSQDAPAREALPSHLKDAPIPFLIELRKYVLQKSPDFISYITRLSMDVYDTPIDAESLVNVLNKKGALVFFDGLDEVFDPDERRRVLDQFQTFAHRYRQARIVVTSRIAGYDRTTLGLAGFVHYTLLPLTLDQIRHFTGQWYHYYTLEGTERTAQGLVQRIIESPRLLDLAGNPLLLTMMALIYKDRDLPNERWRLYERCAETLLEDWELGKGIESEDFKLAVLIRTAQKSEILQRVSMYMLEHGQKDRELNAIAYLPLLNIVASYLEEKYQRSRGDAEAVAVDILQHLMERTYVLAGIGERVFGFVHRTFMEYFAACWCQSQFNARKSDFTWLNRDIFGAHWQGGEWEEVLLLLIAMLQDQGTPIREVVEYLRRKHRTTIPFNLAFAARCLGEAGDVQDPVHAQELLGELSWEITKYASQTRKEKARQFVETALKAFTDLAPQVVTSAKVQKAIKKLNQVGGMAARMAAWQMDFALRSRKERLDYALAALHDKKEGVRRGAIAALEREWPGRSDIGSELVEVVRNDRVGRVRQSALGAMQRSWRYEPAILDAIAGRVDEETSYTYVIRLIEYLVKTWPGNYIAFDLILKLIAPKPKAGSDYDYAGVTQVAGLAIAEGWGGDAQALTSLQDLATSEPDPQTRSAVFQAIAKGWGGDAQALTFLQDLATSEPEPQTRAVVFQAIAEGWGGDIQALTFLRPRIKSEPDSQTRSAVFQAIAEGWGGDAQALTFLQDLTTSEPEPQTRAVVFQAIAEGWGGDAQALTFLQDLATSEPEPQTRAAAFQAIAWYWHGDAQALTFLQDQATSEPEPQTRAAMLQAIAQGWHGDAQALTFLQNLATSEPDPQTRAAAFQAIAQGWREDEQALTFLRDRITSEPDPQTRAALIQILGWAIQYYFVWDWRFDLHQNRIISVETLVESVLAILHDCALNDQDVAVRAMAISSFPYLIDSKTSRFRPNVLSTLQDRAMNDPESYIRVIALERIARNFVNPRAGFGNWEESEASAFLRNNLEFLRQQVTESAEAGTRSVALWAIADGLIGDTQALAILKDRATNDPDAQTRLDGVRAIGWGWSGDAQALAFLQDRAESDPEVGNRSAIRELLEGLSRGKRARYIAQTDQIWLTYFD